MSSTENKTLVNPLALSGCQVRSGDSAASLLDVSYVRIVTQDVPEWASFTERASLPIELSLDRYRFRVGASVQARGDGWMRLTLDTVLPSARASLRSFLSPKKIGESLLEDWRTDQARHFHGLNESELWFDGNGAVVFSYLDHRSPDSQFLLYIRDRRAVLRVGTMPRSQYMGLKGFEEEIPLLPLNDGEMYERVGECRDIVTNFRPVGQLEFHLKQRLLGLISEYLYSTTRGPERPARDRIDRVETNPA